MIRGIKKFIVYFLLILFVLQAPAYAYATLEEEGDDDIGLVADDFEGDPDDMTDAFSDPYDGPSVPYQIGILAETYADNIDPATGELLEGTRSTSRNFVSDRIIMNATDRMEVEQITGILSFIPDLSIPANLASQTPEENDEEALGNLYFSDRDEYDKIAAQYQAKYTNAEIKRLAMASPNDLAPVLRMDVLTLNNYLVTESGKKLIESEIDRILAISIDRRVIKTLNYLVRPKDDPRGGAGHTRIKVYRLRRNYTRVQDSSESDANRTNAEASGSGANEQTVEDYRAEDPEGAAQLLGEAGINQEDAMAVGEIRDENGQEVTDFAITDADLARNISAHSKGMAIDISEVDQIKCTLIKKRRVGSDKKIPQRPSNIKLQWQTTEGYAKDAEALNSSFNQLFMNDARSSILEMLSSLDVDFENIDSISANNFSEIAALVGQAFFANALNTTGDDSIWKFNLGDILHKIGGVILADGLSLDRQPFLDTTVNSIDDLSIAIGRYGIEKKLQLPYGSMAGINKEQMLVNIGKERIAKELGLPPKTLQFEIKDQPDLYQRIGSRIIESEFALPEGSFYDKSGMTALKGSVNEYKLRTILAFPEALDSTLYLTEGATSALVSGKISVKQFVELIAKAHLGQIAYTYSNFVPRGGSDPFGWCNPNIISGGANDEESCEQWQLYQDTYHNQPTDGQYINWRDEMFNFPEGTMDKLLGDPMAITELEYKNAGIYSIVNVLEPNDLGRTRLTQWFNEPNTNLTIETPIELPEGSVMEDSISEDETQEPDEPITETVTLARESYASNLSIQPNDFYLLFGSNVVTTGIFKRLGEKTITSAIKNSSYVERKRQELIAGNSTLGHLLREYEFYKARVDAIKEHLPLATQRINDVKTSLSRESITEELLPQRVRDNYSQIMESFESATNQSRYIDPSNINALTSAVNVVMINSDALNAETNNIITTLQSSAIGEVNSVVNKINALNMEVEIIARNAYEIISGDEQPNFRIEDLSAASVVSRLDQDLGDVRIGQGELLLFLSGKLTLKDYLLSVGSAKLASELNLPPKAFKYAAKIVESLTGKGKSNIKDAFFRAFGMAALEDSVSTTTQNQTSGVFDNSAGDNYSIKKTRDQIAERAKVPVATANAILAEALGMKGFDLEALMLDSFGAWQQARPKAQSNDLKNHLPVGTTENFILGKAFGEFESELSDDNIRIFSSKLHISEAAVKAFMEAKNGRANPSTNKIYFVDTNEYIPRTGVTDGTCSVYANPNDSGELLGHSAYYYFDRDGMHTFQSYQAANEYVIAHPDREINYVEEFAYSISAALEFTKMDTSEEGRTNASELVGESPSNVDNYIMNVIRSYSEPIQIGSQENIMDPGAPSNYGRIIDDFLNKYSSVDTVKQSLEKFISDNKQPEVFFEAGDGVSHLPEILHIKMGIPENVTAAIFERSVTENVDVSVDFFKVSGYNLLKSFMTAYLNNALGISIGDSTLTPADIFAVFNGGGREVFSRIGGSILDEELGLERGTTAMLLSTNRDERECAMANAASQLIGDVIGVPGLDLESLITNSFGARTIERTLNFGTGTFKGANTQELVSNVGELNFIRAFAIPYPKNYEEYVDDVLQQIGADYYDANKGKDYFDKAKAVYDYIQGIGTNIDNERYSWLKLFENVLKERTSALITRFLEFSTMADVGGRDEAYVATQMSEFFFGDEGKNEFNEKYERHIARLTNIDSIFNISDQNKNTKKLIMGQVSPAGYADHFQSQGLENAITRVITEKTGLTEKGITDDEFNKFVAALRSVADGHSLFDIPDSGYQFGTSQQVNTESGALPNAASNIYIFFTKYFSLDLDEKANFDQGTIQRIIENPGMAIEILAVQGARMLDRQLGIPVHDEVTAWGETSEPGEESSYSFSGAMQRYYREENMRNITCNSSDPVEKSNCLHQARLDYFENYAIEAGQYSLTRAMSREIESATEIPVNILNEDGTLSRQDKQGIQIPRNALQDLFHGDFRALMVVGTAMGLKASLVKDKDALASQRFFIDFAEIYLCFYSDPALEEAARQRGRDSAISELTRETIPETDPNNPNDPGWYPDDTGEYGPDVPPADIDEPNHSAQPGNTQPIAINNNVIEGTPTDPTDYTEGVVNDTYPVPEGGVDENLLLPDPGAAPAMIDPDNPGFTTPEYQEWSSRNEAYQDQQSTIRQSEEGAVDLVRTTFREYYQYKVMDGVLQKFNKYIPSGFSMAMYKGDSFAKTCALIGFVENWLRNETSIGRYFNEGDLAKIYNYVKNPGETTYTELLSIGLLDRVDAYLLEHSPSIMGMTFEPKTAQALFAFLYTGNISQNLEFGGTQIKSLSNIYNSEWIAGRVCSWADEKLSLPAGTISKSYSMYKQYKAVKGAMSLYSGSLAALQAPVLVNGVATPSAFTTQLNAYNAANPKAPLDAKAFQKMKLDQTKLQMRQLKAEIITLIITIVFAKQIAKMEEALGLVPGTGAMLVGMMVQAAMSVPIPWVQVAIFVLVNLLGYYKTIMVCTADGYYPAVEKPLDGNRWDVGGLGTFDGMDSNAREENYMKAAQYKANRLVGDLYEMPMRTGDAKLVPTQTMTARWEDVDPWAHLLDSTICLNLKRKRDNNLCAGSKAGIWSNIQMQTYTHIGY